MPEDFVIIANPVSGSRKSPKVAAEIERSLRTRGARVELILTSARGEAFQIARQAACQGVKAVVGCGGDGTLQEIATALERTDSSMGIVPCGRCNDFGRALRIYRSDSLARLTETLMTGGVKAIDLGGLGAKRFLTVATLGFDSDVSRFVETRQLWVRGTAAYLYGVVRMLIRFNSPEVSLKGDFGAYHGRILLSATGNAPSYGGAMHIAPGARMDDGLFHLCVVEKVSRLTVMLMLPKVLKGTHIHHPAVRLFETSFVEIRTPECPQWICADGESLTQTPARFEVHPKALKVLVPV